jgi:hypothetical protein
MTNANSVPIFAFPHTILDPTEGRPTNASNLTLCRQSYANACSAFPPVNAGPYGFLGMVMPAADYANRPGNPVFVMPPPPGNRPPVAGLTAIAATASNTAHDDAVANYNAHLAMSAALRQQLLAAVDDTYTRILKDDLLGYGDVTPRAIIEHLVTTYGEIQPEEIAANTARLNAEWDWNAPIEDYWVRLEECQSFANRAGEPVLEATMIRTAFSHFEKSQVIAVQCAAWSGLPAQNPVPTPAEMWVLFKNHFNKAERDRHRQITASGAGYNGANAAVVTPATETAAAANTTARGAPAPAPGPMPPAAQRALFGNGIGGYCWTHGLCKNPKHTSATCMKRAEGHKEDATAFNRMGGSTKFPGMPRNEANE